MSRIVSVASMLFGEYFFFFPPQSSHEKQQTVARIYFGFIYSDTAARCSPRRPHAVHGAACLCWSLRKKYIHLINFKNTFFVHHPHPPPFLNEPSQSLLKDKRSGTSYRCCNEIPVKDPFWLAAARPPSFILCSGSISSKVFWSFWQLEIPMC